MSDIHDLEHLADFRQIVDGELNQFLNSSKAIGGLVESLGEKVKEAFRVHYNFILSGVTMSRPVDDKLNKMLEPLSNIINDIQEFRNKNRHEEKFFNHLSTINDSIMALSWVTRASPARFVKEMKDAGDYFGNRVLAANRSNQDHVMFIRNWGKVLTALENYVLQHHRTGFDWAAAVRAGLANASIGASDIAPPPPPPPPPCQPETVGSNPDRSALFSQINAKGENITEMLRPVRSTGSSSGTSPASKQLGSAKPAVRPQNAPVFLLEGKKWRVEYQRENYALVLESNDMSESLNMYKCENTGLEVRNKMNGITIDNCKRCTIAIKDIISSVDLIRCSNVKIQCNGTVPLTNIDNSDSVQIFLTKDALGMQLITSKCSSLNICLLNEDGTYVELPVPEQIRTVVSNGKLQSTALEKQ